MWQPHTQVPATAGHLLEHRFAQANARVSGFVLLVGLMLLLNVQEARQTAGAIAAFVARSGAHRP